MPAKCVHKGCGKTFEDEDEACTYHPGPPEFHEGTKGWKCCKPRVLSFDDFLTIPPCTTGKHSTVDDTPQPVADPAPEVTTPQPQPTNGASFDAASATRQPRPPPTQTRQAAPAPDPESDSDEPGTPIPDNTTCKRRGCGASSSQLKNAAVQKCVYHRGSPIFHEGSKGWTCCKRRVLEFDEFMKIQGCKTRDTHCFTGKTKQKSSRQGGASEYEKLATVRHDFYQTGSTLHVSLFLKKIDKDKSKVEFTDSGTELDLDLKTQDEKQYIARVPLYGRIDPAKSTFNILGTKLDLTLIKADAAGWPVLRADERLTGEIIQTGSAGRA